MNKKILRHKVGHNSVASKEDTEYTCLSPLFNSIEVYYRDKRRRGAVTVHAASYFTRFDLQILADADRSACIFTNAMSAVNPLRQEPRWRGASMLSCRPGDRGF